MMAAVVTEEDEEKTSSSIFLQIIEHPDGSVTKPSWPTVPPTTPSQQELSGARTSSSTPPTAPNSASTSQLISSSIIIIMLVIVYYHGGGFVLFSPDFVLYHHFCSQMAHSLPALVVSLDYRLAPDHRLPAAYDDALDAIRWVLVQKKKKKLAEHGDLSRCFVMGSSSGGLLCGAAGGEPRPEAGGGCAGAALLWRGGEDAVGVRASDLMWRLALPQGSNRDHPYCNPLTTTTDDDDDDVMMKMPKTMVNGCRGDPLFDRQKLFVNMLVDRKRDVVVDLEEEEEQGGYHAIELFDADRAQALFARIRDQFPLVSSSASAPQSSTSTNTSSSNN